MLCFAAELNARCYSPWEFAAKELNDLDETHGEGARDKAWAAYDEGVNLAIEHDLEGYTPEDYGIEPEESDPNMHSMNATADLYIDWVNNFMSVERFAEYHQLSDPHRVIATGRRAHERRVARYKRSKAAKGV